MIFTERKITVRKGKSSIDEPVILYRGDYEVELRFIIMETKFRFKSGVNLVDSEKASHAQLALLAPDGANVFTEIGRCEDGTAIFTLSKEMIDELSEVGLYSFQIRLFDYYRESRVSIPPVEFGIEVREPIAAEDHTNAVDDAMVGYSIAKTSVLDEPVPETFDDDGEYNKTVWETGDRITEGKLNKIEDALGVINNNAMNEHARLDRKIDSNFNVLDTTKADQTYVDNKVAAVASGSPNGVYASLSALQSALPKGDKNIYITSDNGCWNYWDGSKWTSGGVYQSTGLSDNSVYSHHLNGGVDNINLYDKGRAIIGQYVNTKWEIITSPTTAYAKVPVKPNNSYVLGRKLPSDQQKNSMISGDPFRVEDASGNVVLMANTGEYYKGTDVDGVRYAIIPMPVGAAYLCFNLKVLSFDSIEKSYCYNTADIGIEIVSLAESETITKMFGSAIADTEGRASLQTFRASVKNISNDIYAKTVLLDDDSYVNTNGTMSAAQGWIRAQMIIDPNTTYCIYFASQRYSTERGVMTFRDASNAQIIFTKFEDMETVFLDNGEYYKRFTTPAGCYLISFTVRAGAEQNYSWDDSKSTIVTKDIMTLDDLSPYVGEIDGVPVLLPSKIKELIKLPEIESTWDINLLHHPDRVYRENMLYNNSGTLQGVAGWAAVDIPIEGGTTYYFYSPACASSTQYYEDGLRGDIVMLDEYRHYIGSITGQATKTLSLSNGYWQIIDTVENARYLGITVKRPEGNFSDLERGGMLFDFIPDESLFTPYITKINNYEIKAANVPTITTTWDSNIFHKNGKVTSSVLYNNKANRQTASGWMINDIKVEPGGTYYFYSQSNNYKTGERGCIVLLDSASNIIKAIEGQATNMHITSDSKTWQIIETTIDTAAIGITIFNPNVGANIDDRETGVLLDREPKAGDDRAMVNSINGLPIAGLTNIADYNHPLRGKKWVVVGDSLTEFNYRATKNYHHYVAEETGVIVVNMGVSGTGYMRRQEEGRAFYQRILNIPTDTDIVTIFGSGNDLSLTLGTPSDTGEDTICGCMRKTIENLFSVLPGVRVGIVLPCPWGNVPPHQKGNKMELYSTALKEIAAEYSIPVLDLYYGSNLRPWDPTFRDLYYKRDDGSSVHPDEDGHALLANKFKMFIQGL